MRRGEHAVTDEGAIVEEADIGQELDGRLAITRGPIPVGKPRWYTGAWVTCSCKMRWIWNRAASRFFRSSSLA
jgi:hypothetical protein